MKKIYNLFLVASLFILGIISCEQQSEVPGGIPGMGETPGELEIKEPFVPPDGVSYEVVGGEELSLEDIIGSGQNKLKSSLNNSVYGSGGSIYNSDFRLWITVKLTFTNKSNKNRRITLKKGLIFKVVEPGYQNGILLNRVIFYVKAHCSRTISVIAYCLNRGRDGSNENLHYTIPGVTDSKKMWKKLLDKLENRMVNIENFIVPSGSPSLKSINEYDIDKYMEIADHLQNMVWTLTNDGTELSQEQKDYLESLPKIEE